MRSWGSVEEVVSCGALWGVVLGAPAASIEERLGPSSGEFSSRDGSKTLRFGDLQVTLTSSGMVRLITLWLVTGTVGTGSRARRVTWRETAAKEHLRELVEVEVDQPNLLQGHCQSGAGRMEVLAAFGDNGELEKLSMWSART